MNRLLLVALLGITAAGLALLWPGYTQRVMKISVPESKGGQVREQPDESGPVPAMVSVGMTAEVTSFAGFPAAIVQDPARRYAYAKDCMKFRHFDTFYRKRAADPDWPLSSPEAFAAAPAEVQAQLIERLRFLDEHRASCTPWFETASPDLAQAQAYEASLQAALQGDRNAAACFLRASWASPSEQSPYYAGVVNAYATHAPRFVQEGLRTGNWPIVLAASMAGRTEHGMQNRAGFSLRDRYLFDKLLQLGATNAQDELLYGSQAAEYAVPWPAKEIVELDERAADLFASRFGKNKTTAQAVIDMCSN